MTDTEDKKSPLTFPCDFVVKVFGVATEQFETDITNLMRGHYPDLHASAVNSRPSKDGKYIALSILIHPQSQAELDAVYYDLTANPLVLMAL